MAGKVFEIEGYVKNEGRDAYFKLQRGLPAGGKITFAQAFAAVGKQSGKEGPAFIDWLRETHFSGSEWGFYGAGDRPYFAPKAEVAAVKQEHSSSIGLGEASPTVDPGKGAGRPMRRVNQHQKTKGVEITADAMVQDNFAAAKVLIDACKSRRELKKALTLSQRLSHREDHMRYLHNRLQQV